MGASGGCTRTGWYLEAPRLGCSFTTSSPSYSLQNPCMYIGSVPQATAPSLTFGIVPCVVRIPSLATRTFEPQQRILRQQEFLPLLRPLSSRRRLFMSPSNLKQGRIKVAISCLSTLQNVAATKLRDAAYQVRRQSQHQAALRQLGPPSICKSQWAEMERVTHHPAAGAVTDACKYASQRHGSSSSVSLRI